MIRPAQKVMIACLLTLMLSATISTPSSGGTAYAWNIETISVEPVHTFYYETTSAIALDSKGTPHVLMSASNGSSYYSQTLVYATVVNGSWVYSNITDDPVVSPSIAIGPNDEPIVVYCLDWSNDVYCARQASGEWNLTKIGEPYYNLPFGGGYASIRTSMAIDREGHIFVALHAIDGNSSLQIISNVNGTWGSEVVTKLDNVSIPSIAIGSDGTLHVMYYHFLAGYLVHAWKSGDSWTNETLNLPRQPFSSLGTICVDSQGRLHAAISQDNRRGHYPYLQMRIVHAVRDSGGVWSNETVNNTINGYSPSMAIDSSSVIHLAFEDGEERDLISANNAGGIWTCQRVDSVDFVGRDSSIAVDALGNSHILYWNDTGLRYKYAVSTGTITVHPSSQALNLAPVLLVAGAAAVGLGTGLVVGRRRRPPLPEPSPASGGPPEAQG